MKRVFFILLILGIFVPAIWFFICKFEGSEPEVKVTLPSVYLKKSYEMDLKIVEKGTGLRKIIVSIMQKGNEKILLEKEYDSPGLMSMLSDKKQLTDDFSIPVQSWKYGMTDGEAVIKIHASDFSWQGWNKGNIAYIEKEVIIDSKPPKINILTKQHNMTRGGTGLVVYKVFEENVTTGVRVGENYFPGASGLFNDKNIHAAFFALDHNQGPGTQIAVLAEDVAGNISKRGFYHYIREKNFKTDTLTISDWFLNNRIANFDLGEKQGAFSSKKNPLLASFLYVNEDMRKENVKTILGLSDKSSNQMFWEGKFKRLAGAARKAGYADKRIYKYKGKEIDRATHLGIDLASTANAPVPAANSGKVILAKSVGIFGNTVIIDHGFRVMSLYSHLNNISVNEGDMVNKSDIIGNTGYTGLAGGDHLHFSMIIHNIFVNPIEWWDTAWIKNNVTAK
ncbi:MAG: M23 family metallopeptidase, partial [Desulfobacteraceae bacterium]|nr:M23 family metallopeptidase [Desulfobacteraceae bacterium]